MAIDVRPATPADRPALLSLFRVAFGAEPSSADWEWKYDRAPHRAISIGAFEGGRALGFFGGLGTRYRGAGGDLAGLAAVDVMTLPATRALGRRTFFQELGEAFFRANAGTGAPFVLGFPNERHRVAGERTLQYRGIEPAAQWARPVARGSLLGRLRRRLLRVARGTSLSPGHAALAEALHERPGWRTDRSAATLAWRFARPDVAYDLFELLDRKGRSRAYAAVRLVGERALLVDVQAADEGAGDPADLLDAVAEAYADSSARTLELRAGSASALARRAAELGFGPIPTDTQFTVRALDPAFGVEAAARAFDYRLLDHEIF